MLASFLQLSAESDPTQCVLCAFCLLLILGPMLIGEVTRTQVRAGCLHAGHQRVAAVCMPAWCAKSRTCLQRRASCSQEADTHVLLQAGTLPLLRPCQQEASTPSRIVPLCAWPCMHLQVIMRRTAWQDTTAIGSQCSCVHTYIHQLARFAWPCMHAAIVLDYPCMFTCFCCSDWLGRTAEEWQ